MDKYAGCTCYGPQDEERKGGREGCPVHGPRPKEEEMDHTWTPSRILHVSDAGEVDWLVRAANSYPALLAALQDIADSDRSNWSGYTARGVAYDLATRAQAAIAKATS